MQAFIEFLLKQVKAFWPLAVVNEWEKAILVRLGVIVRSLQPGLYWRWPFVEEVLTYPATECVVDLGTAAISISGQGFAISANLSYRMADMALNWRTLWNVDKSLATVALGIVASRCAGSTVQDLAERKALEAVLLAALQAAGSEWGIEVVRFHLTDCVTLKAHRHYVEGMNG